MKSRTSRPFRFVASLLVFVAALAACGDDPFVPELDPVLGIDIHAMTRTDSGLYYQDLVVGDGTAAQAGDSVSVHYQGWLADGTEFGEGTFAFVLARGDVVAGFDEGVTGMRTGGTRRLVVPPDLGYGDRDYGPIPGKSTLVFEVDLLEVYP